MPTVTPRARFQARQMFLWIVTICLLSMLIVSCSSLPDKMDKLDQTLRGYEKALRWAKFNMAYSFRKWDAGEEPSLPAHLKNIRITSYEVVSQNFNEKTMTTKLSVSIRYYNQENLRERSLQDKQVWKFFPAQKRWYLISEPPTFQ